MTLKEKFLEIIASYSSDIEGILSWNIMDKPDFRDEFWGAVMVFLFIALVLWVLHILLGIISNNKISLNVITPTALLFPFLVYFLKILVWFTNTH